MDKFIINGGKKLTGKIAVTGAKNVALKALVAACLTEETVTINNIPLISDFFVMVDIIKELGGEVAIVGHTASVTVKNFTKADISLEEASHIRTSSMFLAPLLARHKHAIIPNPGGCRLGARPIDRIIEGLQKMGADIVYKSEDGFFHAKTDGLRGTSYRFQKNTHTGTETLIISAVLAKGQTVLENAAQEPEIDELIALLTSMGANIERTAPRTIVITGVEKLHGTTFAIHPDRNEVVTIAIAALVTKGDVLVEGTKKADLKEFLEKLEEVGGGIEEKEDGIRFFYKGKLKAVDVVTNSYPGFMTDWQAPWAVLMTQAEGESIIHETIFENKLGYVVDLKKMGANATLFNPKIENPEEFYNFNIKDDSPAYFHAVKIKGPTPLHNAIVTMENIRAGAAVVIAALAAQGKSTIFGIEKLDRGYEDFENRLQRLGADIQRVTEK